MSWLIGFFKTNKYSIWFPLISGLLLFTTLRDIFQFWPLYINFIFWELICLAVWFFYLIKIPTFGKKDIGILIVFPTVPKLYEEIKSIAEELGRLIPTLNTQSNIKIKVTRNNLFLQNKDEIIKILEKTGATLIVYAEFHHDTKNSESLCSFRRIQFVTRFPKGVLSLQNDIAREFEKVHVGYSLRDTLGKKQQMLEDVTILSTFILSNALRAFGNLEIAENLLKELRQNIPATRSSIAIKKNLSLCKLAQAQKIYDEQIYRNGNFNLNKTILNNIRELLIKAYELNDSYGNIFLLLSVINFLLGEPKKARDNVQRALLRAPKGNYVANISFSFLYCYFYNPGLAKYNWDKFYQDENAQPIKDRGIWHMINFTEYALQKEPERYCLYYHLACIYRMNNLNIAAEKMKVFLKECKKHCMFTNFALEEVKILDDFLREDQIQSA